MPSSGRCKKRAPEDLDPLDSRMAQQPAGVCHLRRQLERKGAPQTRIPSRIRHCTPVVPRLHRRSRWSDSGWRDGQSVCRRCCSICLTHLPSQSRISSPASCKQDCRVEPHLEAHDLTGKVRKLLLYYQHKGSQMDPYHHHWRHHD